MIGHDRGRGTTSALRSGDTTPYLVFVLIPTYATLAEAYADGVRTLLKSGERVEGTRDPTSIGSEFGTNPRETLELRPFGFRVADPHACLLLSQERQPEFSYVIGQWLWTMRGDDRLDSIAYYNGRGRLFSDDGHRLSGAFGARMRGGEDQLAAALGRLRMDSTSRRATVTLGHSSDVVGASRDFSCAAGLQFFLRQRRLEVVTTMRSQSALMVLPYDAALFMLVHLWAAASLGVPAGSHTWLANSFHVYADEVEIARRVVDEGPTSIRFPPLGDHGRLVGLQVVERTLREAANADDRAAISQHLGGLRGGTDALDAMEACLVAEAAIQVADAAMWRDAVQLLPEEWQRAVRLRAAKRIPELADR